MASQTKRLSWAGIGVLVLSLVLVADMVRQWRRDRDDDRSPAGIKSAFREVKPAESVSRAGSRPAMAKLKAMARELSAANDIRVNLDPESEEGKRLWVNTDLPERPLTKVERLAIWKMRTAILNAQADEVYGRLPDTDAETPKGGLPQARRSQPVNRDPDEGTLFPRSEFHKEFQENYSAAQRYRW